MIHGPTTPDFEANEQRQYMIQDAKRGIWKRSLSGGVEMFVYGVGSSAGLEGCMSTLRSACDRQVHGTF